MTKQYFINIMNDHNTIIIFKKLKIFNILIAFIFFINFKFLGKMKKYFVFLILIFGKTLGNKIMIVPN